MSLTFEMANLDFAPLYGQSFARCGDAQSAALMAQIVQDEINHVSFGYRWLQKLKGAAPAWDAWTQSLTPDITPRRARGFLYNEENRRKAGLPDAWIHNLAAS
jgi:uncharacterized ferritin-like protein (DUF455 family)